MENTQWIERQKYLSDVDKRIVAVKDGYGVLDFFTPYAGSPQEERLYESWGKGIYPSVANIAVTYDCQMDCIHCSAKTLKKDSADYLSTDKLMEAVDNIIEMGTTTIIFTGGEPLLNKDIFKLINHIPKDKAQTILFTNGLGLDDKTIDLLKDSGLSSIFVSVDHVLRDRHDDMRNYPGAFRGAIEGLVRCLDAGMLAGIGTYLYDGNKDTFEELMASAYLLGVHNVFVTNYIPAGKHINGNRLKFFSKEDRYKLYEIERKYESLPRPMAITYKDHSACLDETTMSLSAYGDVMFCDFCPMSFGNVNDINVADAWAEMLNHTHLKTCNGDKRCFKCRMHCEKFRAGVIDGKTNFPIFIDKEDRIPCQGQCQ